MNTKIIRGNPQELKLLEVNARYMRHEEFTRLVENVRRDGKLTSVPFACLDSDGKYEVLSGNHRVKAAISAGLEEIDIMVTDDPLTRQQKIAIQLSHNAIAGQDDPVILKQLYDELQEVDWRMYTGLDDVTLDMLDKVDSFSLSEPNLDFLTMSIVFLPDELEQAKEVLEEALKQVTGDEVWLARYEQYDDWLDSIELAGAATGIKNNATALKLVLDTFQANISDLAGLYEDEARKAGDWVPVAPILGTTAIPLEAARVIGQAIQKMVDRGEITKKNLWQAIEYWAADYLSE